VPAVAASRFDWILLWPTSFFIAQRASALISVVTADMSVNQLHGIDSVGIGERCILSVSMDVKTARFHTVDRSF
jgi:hypothetical protein